MEKILSMMGLALKAGRVEVGEEPVGAAARAKKARVIFIAEDAAASSVRRAMSFAESGSCLALQIDAAKEQLGRALGRTSVAMAAVTEIGFAEAIVKKLAALDPERYRAAAEQLAVKAQRAAQRQAEQRQHEKNLRQGKKSVRAESAPAKETASGSGESRTAARDGGRSTRKPLTQAERAARQRFNSKAAARQRYADSRPVKKGKGSTRKESK